VASGRLGMVPADPWPHGKVPLPLPLSAPFAGRGGCECSWEQLRYLLGWRVAEKPGTGESYAAFDEAGGGNVTRRAGLRPTAKALD
jgi:hypothetical protein